MKVSQLFTKTLKTSPRDEVSINARLLIRAGFIDKVAPGIYSYLPLGLRVLKKIEAIIRDEMNAIGGQEILMPALIPAQNWKKTNRWEELDVLYKLDGVDKKQYALGATHEEVVSPLVQRYVSSYKDLPLAVYQIQTKFRNELRAKSGLLRGREFLMKDLYSFHASEVDLERYYARAQQAYKNVFARCGVGGTTYLTLASGGTFSKYSHEYQTFTPYGEDIVYFCRNCSRGVNKEIIEAVERRCPECQNNDLAEEKAIEVGNIFKLGTKYSTPFDVSFVDEAGKKQTIVMGCYGIGVSRLLGAIVETLHDEAGIVWPAAVAPFHVVLIDLRRSPNPSSFVAALKKAGLQVLVDDRYDVSAGVKFSDADLLGIPFRAVLSQKTKNKIEIKNRQTGAVELVSSRHLVAKLKRFTQS